MTTPIRVIYAAEVIGQWQEAAAAAISALEAWRAKLTAWGNGGGLVTPAELAEALGQLDAAGLGEWAEWAPAGGGLDALAEVVTNGHP